jgi:hypothetical protein
VFLNTTPKKKRGDNDENDNGDDGSDGNNNTNGSRHKSLAMRTASCQLPGLQPGALTKPKPATSANIPPFQRIDQPC